MISWSDANVLVTGAGFLGRKFVDIVMREKRPKRLIVFSRDELKQSRYAAAVYPDDVCQPTPASSSATSATGRLQRAIRGVDVVVHAAALKRGADPAEYNPFEAVQTNVSAPKNVIAAAIEQRRPSLRSLALRHRQGGQPGQSLWRDEALR